MNDEQPFLTIAMPVKNRAWCLSEVLSAITDIEYPKERLRLVFVDAFSEDGTYKMLLDFASKYSSSYERIIVLRKHSNIPAARNTCIEHLKGEYLFFADSDVLVPPNCISRALSIFGRDRRIGIVAYDYFSDRPTLMEKMNALSRPKAPFDSPGAGMGATFIKTEVILKIGIFDESFTAYEDIHFSSKAMKNSYRVILDPTTVCLHLKPFRKEGFFDLIKNFSKELAKYHFMLISDVMPTRHVRRLIYYTGFLLGILLIPVSYIPALAFFILGYVYHFKTLRGRARLTYPFLFMLLGFALTLGIYARFLGRHVQQAEVSG